MLTNVCTVLLLSLKLLVRRPAATNTLDTITIAGEMVKGIAQVEGMKAGVAGVEVDG